MEERAEHSAAGLARGVLDPLFRAELNRVLASPQFANAGRLQRFLRYVVDSVVNGTPENLKESVIGVQVFDLEIGFDPKLNPVVRVTARRLREKLSEFYAEEKSGGSGMMIELAKGTYVPQLVPRSLDEAAKSGANLEDPSEPEFEPEQIKPGASSNSRTLQKYGLIAVAAAALLFAAAAVTWSLRSARPRPFQAPVSRFTIDLPEDQLLQQWYGANLAFSPDGATLAYAARRNAVQQLFLRNLRQGESRVIPDSESAVAPFFSASGDAVFGIVQEKPALRKFLLKGGSTDLATLSPSTTVWGGLSDPRAGIFFNDCPPGGADGSSAVYRLGMEPPARPERITWRPPDSRVPEAQMIQQVLPGGDLLVSVNGSSFFITVVSRATGRRKTVVDNARGGLYVPTGHLIFWRGGNLMAAPFDIRRKELTGAALVAVPHVGFSGWQGAEMAVSAEGALAYVRRSSPVPDRTLVWVDLKGQETPVPILPGPVEPMDLSPDGSRLLLARYHPDADQWTLWNYSLKDGSAIQLTQPSRFRPYACFSPDGKQVIFSSNLETAGVTDLFLENSDGAGIPKRVLHPPDGGAVPHVWTSDGNWLVYVRGMNSATKSDIWIMPMGREGDPHPIVITPDYDKSPSVSPNGRWIAYVSNDHVRIQRFPDSQGAAPLDLGGGDGPLWARDGKRLYFWRGERMLAVDLDPDNSSRVNQPAVLFSGKFMSPGLWTRLSMIAPDGKRFLLVRERLDPGEGHRIDIVMNWFTELASLSLPERQ